MRNLFSISVLLLLVGCGSDQDIETTDAAPESTTPELVVGDWVFKMDLGEGVLPFNAQLTKGESGLELHIINDLETIILGDLRQDGDSVFFTLPVFDSEFRGVTTDGSTIEGVWCNFIKGPEYMIPFTAVSGTSDRFEGHHTMPLTLTGKWEVDFSPGTEDMYKAIGMFSADTDHAFGTFITETGDYRFLDGEVEGDRLRLSCFDGSHAFLFEGTIAGDSIIDGMFWSGTHWSEPWVASRNDEFELRDPYSITYLVDGYDKLEFSFPNLEGDRVSLEDERFMDKVVIVQIMGSWCPNCYDETQFYTALYDQYNSDGLEIVALCYEKTEDFDEASKIITKLRTNLNCNYEFLVAGYANKDQTSQSLPMLNEIVSYPTSIIIDRSGKIRKIHTGFYGPGTGDYYTHYTEDFTLQIEKLLAESPL